MGKIAITIGVMMTLAVPIIPSTAIAAQILPKDPAASFLLRRPRKSSQRAHRGYGRPKIALVTEDKGTQSHQYESKSGTSQETAGSRIPMELGMTFWRLSPAVSGGLAPLPPIPGASMPRVSAVAARTE